MAINLSRDVKKELENAVSKIRPLFGPEIRFLSPDNWHLTLEFLAYQDDHSVHLITEALAETGRNFASLFIQFEKIIYGPLGKPPRMIWLTGSKETSEALSEIKDFLEKKLFEYGVQFRQEQRRFNAHLTLARFETTPRSGLPTLDIDFKRSFEAGSLELMESHLKRSGAEYDILSSFDFQGEKS